MKKGIFIFILLILALFSVSCIYAADVNDTLTASDDAAAIEAAQIDEITAGDTSQAVEQIDDDETVNAENDLDKLNTGEAGEVDLTLSKTVNVTNGVVDVGEQVEFTIVAYNNGSGNASGVYVIEELDSHLGEYIYDATPGTTYDGHEWNIGNLDAGANATLKIITQVISQGIFSNHAEIFGNEPDADLSNNNAAISDINAMPVVNLRIEKKVDTDTRFLYCGDTVIFIINIWNDGPCDATNVSVSEVLDPCLTMLSYATWDGYYDDAEGVWHVGELPTRDPWRELVIYAEVTSTGNISNVVSITCTENDTNKSDNYASIPNIIVRPMVAKMTVDKCEIDVNDTVTYTVVIHNNVNYELSDIRVNDSFNDTFKLVDGSVSHNWTYDGNAFVYDGTIAPLTEVILTFNVSIAENGTYRNVVNVSSHEVPVESAESDQIHVYRPDVFIENDAFDCDRVTLGNQAAFIVRLTNAGDRPLNPDDRITVRENFTNSGLAYADSKNDTGKWIASEDGIEFVLNSRLNIGETAAFIIYFNTTRIGESNNRVSVDGFDDRKSENQVTVLPVFTVDVNDTEIDVGESVRYTIFINVTGLDSSTVLVEDVLGESFDLFNYSSDWNWDGKETFTYTFSGTPSAVTLELDVTINKEGNYTNVAELKCKNIDMTSEAREVHVYEPNMTVEKSVDKAEIYVNETVTYTVVVNNTCGRPLYGVNVSDSFNDTFKLLNETISDGWIYANGSFVYGGTIGVGEAVVLRFDVRISEKGTYRNVVVATSLGVPDREAVSNETRVNAPVANKTKTQITANPITATYNANKNLIITLKDANGKALSGVKITVKLKGTKTYTTDKNGQVKISTKGLVPKKYTAKITFNGDKNYAKSAKDVKVTVKKAKAKIFAKKKTYRANKKTKKFKITLKDKNGKPIKKAKVRLIVKKIKKTSKKKTTKKDKNKKKNIKKTNKKGKITFKIKRNKKGKYLATVKFYGNKYYAKAVKKVKIKMK